MSDKFSMAIESAEKILIGVGSEWKYDIAKMSELCGYGCIYTYINSHEEKKWMLPFLEYICMNEQRDEKLLQAYTGLRDFIDGKDFFLISSNCDRFALQCGFDEKKCVFPFGNFDYIQGENGQNDLTKTIDCPSFMSVIDRIRGCKEDISLISDIEMPEINGEKVFFNQKGSCKNKQFRYVEKLYLENWDTYLKWLSDSLNHETLILELGVDLEYPSVIRWPFEKVAMINKKAYMMRINRKLFQLTDEIKEKAVSVKMDSVEYIYQEYVHER